MWNRTNEVNPPENTLLLTKVDHQNCSKNEQRLIKKGNLWWLEDMSMYVYYTPTHWKYVD